MVPDEAVFDAVERLYGDVDDVRRILRTAGGLVVVDEAYQPFAEDSFVDELGQWDNLLVLRTLSKERWPSG